MNIHHESISVGVFNTSLYRNVQHQRVMCAFSNVALKPPSSAAVNSPGLFHELREIDPIARGVALHVDLAHFGRLAAGWQWGHTARSGATPSGKAQGFVDCGPTSAWATQALKRPRCF